MSIILADSITVPSSIPLDAKYGPYATTTAANAAIPTTYRYVGLTVGIGTTTVADYWYNGGIADGNLIAKGGGTVTSVAALTLAISGTDLSSTVENSTTTPVITLNVPTASATNRGVLSSADWTTFNGKQPAGSYITASSADTLTNKRVTPRVATATSSATPTINTDNVDVYGLTAQTVDITSFTTNLSGTPTNGQLLRIYIVGTAARAIAWGSSFEPSTTALPTTTVLTNRLDVGFVWNAATSKWRCLAYA